MFGKSKKAENQHIIAVKDLAGIQKAVMDESTYMPYDKALYRDLLATSGNKAETLKDLKKFIKIENRTAKEVKHYWEGLITQGFTLMEVHYDKKAPTIQNLCSHSNFKYIGEV